MRATTSGQENTGIGSLGFTVGKRWLSEVQGSHIYSQKTARTTEKLYFPGWKGCGKELLLIILRVESVLLWKGYYCFLALNF